MVIEQINKLSDYYKPPVKADTFVPIEEISDTNLILRDYKFATGQWGEYVILTLEMPEGAIVKAQTGQKEIHEVVRLIQDKKLLPCSFRFVFDRKYGRANIWRME